MTWPHEDIKELHKRRYQLRDNALEIFLTNGKTCLLAFDSTKVGNLQTTSSVTFYFDHNQLMVTAANSSQSDMVKSYRPMHSCGNISGLDLKACPG